MNKNILDFKNFIEKETGKPYRIKWGLADDYAYFYHKLYMKKDVMLSDEEIVDNLQRSPKAEKYGFQFSVIVFTDKIACSTLYIPKSKEDAEDRWINGPKYSIWLRPPQVRIAKNRWYFSFLKLFERVPSITDDMMSYDDLKYHKLALHTERIDWLKSVLAEKKHDYNLKYISGEDGDFGDLEGLQFDNEKKGGYIFFWSKGIVDYELYDFATEKHVIETTFVELDENTDFKLELKELLENL